MALRIDEWRLKITENVQSVLGKLSGAADRTTQKFTRTQDRMNQAMQRGTASLQKGFKGALGAAGDGVADLKSSMLSALPLPGAMTSGLASMAGPIGVAIALVGGLTLGLVKGVQAAEQFGVGFRELRNLNMNLDDSGIASLKNDLLDLSQAKGLDPQKVTAGYYDIQSATGQTGKAVLDLVGRVGEASRALNMDMSTSINGVGKAMVAFHLQTSDLDMLLASNAKTVQMGIVTFDQLSKSQTEYAGAAASASQTVDSANKVFAVMTQHTKSADIAATYAKGAFMDLSKGSTVAGLKKIGVSVFDANKQMRQADDILRDLVPKLSDMSDETFSNLKEEIGGQEGLRALLDAAKASGTDTLRVLDGFDSSSFDLNKAIKQANGDLDVMKDKLSNSVQVELIRIGEVFMPYIVKMVDGLLGMVHHISGFVNWLREGWQWLKNIYDNSMLVRGVIDGLFLMVRAGWELLSTVVMTVIDSMVTPIKALGAALTGEFSQAFDILQSGADKTIGRWTGAASSVGDAFRVSVNNTMQREIFEVPVKPVIAGAEAPLAASPSAPVVPGAPPAPKADPFASRFKGASGASDASGSGVKQGVSEVVGGGKQVRNVVVNIQSLVKEVKVVTANTVREGAGDIQRAVTEAMVNAVRGAELAVAND